MAGKRIPIHDHSNFNSGGRIDNVVQQVVTSVDSGSGGSGAATSLDDLSDVVLTSPADGHTLIYNGANWINDTRRWEAVTAGEDVFVWDGDDLVHDWSTY